MTTYTYGATVQREVERWLRDALPSRTVLRHASRAEDMAGTDFHWQANGIADVAVRCRFDRPVWAADEDITFRSTERSMITAETYAPLALFLWFREGYAVAGKLVDVYRMANGITPHLFARSKHYNGDGTSFIVVRIAELHDAKALLRQGGRRGWATTTLDGDARIDHLLSGGWAID